jgi:pseudouridine-5'-monophosphatase
MAALAPATSSNEPHLSLQNSAAPAGPGRTIRGAIFDVDGTLLDTEPIYYKAYTAVAAKFGHTYSFDIHRHLLGRNEREGAASFLRILGIPDLTPEELLAQRDEYLMIEMAAVQPMAGAVAAVEGLAARLPTAIATSSLRQYLDVKRANNAVIFDHIHPSAVICGDDEGLQGKSKPDPAIFLAAAKAISVPPTDCIAFEDSLAGIRAAKAAGMYVVAVPDVRLEMDDVRKAGPDVILSSLAEFGTGAQLGLSIIDSHPARPDAKAIPKAVPQVNVESGPLATPNEGI